jgi:hypothetical protein
MKREVWFINQQNEALTMFKLSYRSKYFLMNTHLIEILPWVEDIPNKQLEFLLRRADSSWFFCCTALSLFWFVKPLNKNLINKIKWRMCFFFFPGVQTSIEQFSSTTFVYIVLLRAWGERFDQLMSLLLPFFFLAVHHCYDFGRLTIYLVLSFIQKNVT